MADVAVVIGGDAADIHVDLAGPDRDEFFLFTGKGIVQLHDRSHRLGVEEVDAALMAAAFEFGGQEGIDDGKRQLHARDPGPQAQHVGIVVQAGEAGMQFRGARMPLWRLAAMDMPIPVPQIRMPGTSSASTALHRAWANTG